MGAVYGETHQLRVDQSQDALGIGLFALEDIPAGATILREPSLACVRFASIITRNAEVVVQYARLGPLLNKKTSLPEALGEILIMRGADKDWLSVFTAPGLDMTTASLLDLATTACRFNGFSVNTPICSVPYAYGLYDVATIFNHSCSPNAMQFFPGQISDEILIRTIRDVKKGEEVTVSYTGGLEECKDIQTRKKYLVDDLGFICICQRCVAETISPPADQCCPTTYRPMPEEYMEKLKEAQDCQLTTTKTARSWELYWDVVTQAKGYNIGDDRRFNILLGAASSGMRTPTANPLLVQALLRKLLGMCREKGQLHTMMTIQLVALQSQSGLGPDKEAEGLADWHKAQRAGCAFFGVEAFSTVMDALFCHVIMDLEKRGFSTA